MSGRVKHGALLVEKPLLVLPDSYGPISPEFESKMAEAGYLVITVPDPQQVRIVIPEVIALGHPIVQAALRAIVESNNNVGPRHLFATKLIEALAPPRKGP